jgi:23S rRNA pseudouridine2604 synthase
MRLNKYIAASGFCSRRKADKLIEAGVVTVNGSPATLGTTVSEMDAVSIEGVPISVSDQHIYIAFHKPKGVISTADPNANNSVFDYVDIPERVFFIGRLDVASSGLMLLTNDGKLADKLMHPSNDHEKEYTVKVDKPLNRKLRSVFERGVELDGSLTKPARFKKVGSKSFRAVLTEGRNRQIRRMCEAADFNVIELKRIRIENIKMHDLGPGNWRQLTKRERRELLERSRA